MAFPKAGATEYSQVKRWEPKTQEMAQGTWTICMGQGHHIFSVGAFENSDTKENRTWRAPTLGFRLSRKKEW